MLFFKIVGQEKILHHIVDLKAGPALHLYGMGPHQLCGLYIEKLIAPHSTIDQTDNLHINRFNQASQPQYLVLLHMCS